MRHLLAAFIFLASLSATWAADAVAAPAADDTSFVLSVSAAKAPAPLDAAKAGSVKEGMTLQALVTALGSGWLPKGGKGIVQWSFTDGRTLSILSEHNDKLELVTFKGNGAGTLAWWGTTPLSPSKAPVPHATIP